VLRQGRHGGTQVSAVFKKHERYWDHIAVYGDYLPWNVHRQNGGDGSNYPEHSGRILDLKDDKQGAADHFKNLIEPELKEGIIATRAMNACVLERSSRWPNPSAKKANNAISRPSATFVSFLYSPDKE
jgi:hypothetical protein